MSAERASRVWRCPWPPPRPRRAAPPRAALQVVAAPPATIHPLQTYQLRRRQRAFRPQHLQVASGRRPSRAQPLPAPRAAPRAPWRRKWHARRARGGTCLLRCTGGAAPPPAIEARQSWEFTPPPAPKIPRAPTRPHAPPRAPPRHATREAAPMQRSGLSLITPQIPRAHAPPRARPYDKPRVKPPPCSARDDATAAYEEATAP